MFAGVSPLCRHFLTRFSGEGLPTANFSAKRKPRHSAKTFERFITAQVVAILTARLPLAATATTGQ
jgi:hypothetical protein